ncbi:MAG: replicative DNA helicase [Candidatus Sumerlaeaceae bacterium]|nr:replicative DNA helicase [Candidatus Sumerlaeaceae bacterium]
MSTPGKVIDAALPSNVDAEKTVLGSMILDPDAIDIVAGILRPNFFYQERHQQVYTAILDLHERHTMVDFTTVIDELKRRKQLDAVGGPAYITSLEQYVYSTQNVTHHANIVLRKHQLRELIRVTHEIQEDAYHERDDLEQILDHAEKRIFDLSEQRITREFQEIGTLTLETMDEIDKRSSQAHEVTGVATGYTMLDDWTGGFQPSDLIILAARPSVGKTALALNIALNVGAGFRSRQLHPELARGVGIFSLEMSASQINQRLLSSLSEVSMHQMRTGKLPAGNKEKLHRFARQLHGVPIYIDDTPGLSILELRAKARRLAAMHDISLIIIDYLQLMRGGGRVENRQQEISEITRSLKALARELHVPIIALSQLSRMIEQRKGKQARPMLSDLRESGAIEQDADVVMFIHRERNQDSADDEDDDKPQGPGRKTAEKALLVIGKQRNGPTGDIPLVFFGETATFHNMINYGDDNPGF